MRKVKCQTIMNLIEEMAPKKIAEQWDNVGLLIGDGSQTVKRLMVCLDVPEWVIDEAIEEKVDMIISHHPIIFSSLKKINTDTVLGRKIIKLIKNNISVYAAHTNYDMVKGGLNDIFVNLMGFEKATVIEPIKDLNLSSTEEVSFGLGRLAELNDSTILPIYANSIKKQLDIESIRMAGDPNKSIRRIAFLNGSGGKFIRSARLAGADLLVTGDLGYHEMLDAVEMGLCVIDAGHYATEKIMMKAIYLFLVNKFDQIGYDVEVIQSKTNNDPVVII